jgi:hypothetical protein
MGLASQSRMPKFEGTLADSDSGDADRGFLDYRENRRLDGSRDYWRYRETASLAPIPLITIATTNPLLREREPPAKSA